MISAKIVTDSISPQGERLISFLCVCDSHTANKIAEEHKEFTITKTDIEKVEFDELIKQVKENPFIPIVWKKDNKDIQGIEYWINETNEYLPEYTIPAKSKMKVSDILNNLWLQQRNDTIYQAILINKVGATKQLCNRLLEPFMWTTMLVTTGREGLENFFKLRCPQYDISDSVNGKQFFKSKKDVIELYEDIEDVYQTDLDWLGLNKSQAEIHIMDLAEKMYDCYKESDAKLLQEGEWHIPFRNTFPNEEKLEKIADDLFYVPKLIFNGVDFLTTMEINISTAMAARTSYTVFGDEKEISYEDLIELHNKLITNLPINSSFNHCARVMTIEEHNSFIKGQINLSTFQEGGWCKNYKGFISYGYELKLI